MNLKFVVRYRTEWGQNLMLCLNGAEYPMSYTIDDLWSVQIDATELNGSSLQYNYCVMCNESVVRQEWGVHALELSGVEKYSLLYVNDKWLDNPENSPFYSSLFTKAVFRRNQAANFVIGENNTVITVDFPQIQPDQVVAIVGSGKVLGNWDKVLPLNDANFPSWSIALQVNEPFEFKFVIADKKTLKPFVWESGQNRVFYPQVGPNELAICASMSPRIEPAKWQGAGTAIPVFSLRSEQDFGIGEFNDLKLMADWAATSGQSIIQILPINDTTMSHTWMDSYPYNANSTFALHPQYINLPMAGVQVNEEYLQLQQELNALPQIDYVRVNNEKTRLLRNAFSEKYGSITKRKDYKEFVKGNSEWLIPYAVFCVLRDTFGTSYFAEWGEYATYSEAIVSDFYSANKREVDFHIFIQYNLHKQLSEVVEYAHKKGVVLKGDLPIGISRTSVDAWSNPDLFHMDCQAGAPPDAFSEYGQNWGFPTYNWERMSQDGFAWWRARLAKMAEYFDAFRIDHILGFFRIWEIPLHSVRGLLGYFNPAMPYSTEELAERGFDMRSSFYSKPYCADWAINDRFKELAEYVKVNYMNGSELSADCSTQRDIVARIPQDDEKSKRIVNGLLELTEDLLFIEDPRRKGYYHPRISPFNTYAYKALSPELKHEFDKIHEEFFYQRHNDFWRDSAMLKLPALLKSTSMLACGEDLGMIPACVPWVMADLRLLSLEIQRMPKAMGQEFANPATYPYFSVCTTSTHDMNPIRAWWEEDAEMTQRFYNTVLKLEGDAPESCTPEIAKRILLQHVASPAIFTILPLQDWLAMDGDLRAHDPHAERINVPAIARYYWRYRMHITLEQLLSENSFNQQLKDMLQ